MVPFESRAPVKITARPLSTALYPATGAPFWNFPAKLEENCVICLCLAENKIASRSTRTHSNSSSKRLLFALPASFFEPPRRCSDPTGKIKFDARNFQKSVEKFPNAAKIITFLPNFGKKTPWTLLNFFIKFHFFSLAIFFIKKF